ncbi:hypothetical protein RHOER0001_5799 [Rhodococcus erythropolis SK121]|nr:hypothetical protein RHOER0001_5799 [Rhodococcus erythropolis SK121]
MGSFSGCRVSLSKVRSSRRRNESPLQRVLTGSVVDAEAR